MKTYTNMKLITGIIILLSMSLMPGFWGCTQDRKSIDEQQPQPNFSDVYEQDCRHPAEKQADLMALNTEIEDMRICDVHFLPNRAILNSNGTRRLYHLAWIVERYGGKIYLDVENPKSRLTKQRMRVVRSYLKELGVPNSKIQLAVGLPKAKGMEANEAIEIYDDTRFKPESQTSK